MPRRAARAAEPPRGIVLAGGAGLRMGHPKAVVQLGGMTMVERAVDMMSARCGRVVVVARPQTPLPRVAADVVLDRPGPACALIALATGLAACGPGDVLVTACDLPFAAPMLDALAAVPPGVAAVGRSHAGTQPLCARYPRDAALEAADRLIAAGRLTARGPADALGAREVDDLWDALANVNTPEDLARARDRLAPPDQAG